MAIKMEDILAALDEANLRYSLHELTQEPVILFPTDNFRGENGKNLLIVVIQLTEDGEYIKFFVPAAYHIPLDESAYAVLKSFAIIAWQVKLLDFEVDAGDGEVRPTIDFPIEDGTLTTEQIRRCCKTLARLVDIFHPHIKYALTHNVVHEALLQNDVRPIFEAYNERDGLEEALEGFRERIRQFSLDDDNEDNEDNEADGAEDSDTDQSLPTSTLDTSTNGDQEEESSDDDWI
jgi:hypothetical protein